MSDLFALSSDLGRTARGRAPAETLPAQANLRTKTKQPAPAPQDPRPTTNHQDQQNKKKMAVCEAYGYKVDRLLGRGAFGSVCRATKDNKTVAIKHIAKRFRSWTECLQQREIASLKKCQDRAATRT